MAVGLEVADVFRHFGAAWRADHAGQLSRDHLRVMGAIETCRTAALGGHAEACGDCGHLHISYNSCRNRHCPKCQGLERAEWLADRQAELLPVPYFHVVFTVPPAVAEIAFQNKAVVYDILFRATSETLRTIAVDPKHLGANIGFFAVLHTWGQAILHHPHLHCIVPGGGISLDNQGWVACRPGFFLPVRVLSSTFRRLFLKQLDAAFIDGRLNFYAELARLQDRAEFTRQLAPVRDQDWVVYAKPPFGGPEQVLAYLGRYTHRVAIANSRLVAIGEDTVSFTWKDYRHHDKTKVMTLGADEFIRRFMLHVIPSGFHRIRHYGFLANGQRAAKIAHVRRLLAVPPPGPREVPSDYKERVLQLTGRDLDVCPECGGRMTSKGVIKPSRPHRPNQAKPPNDSS